MCSHWSPDELECFKIPIKHLDTILFDNQLVRCKESDNLFTAFCLMRTQRVNTVAVEADEGCHTVGIFFLNDLLYVLRQNDYPSFFGRTCYSFL
jgi:hypothetical protein